jgi:signal peptidase I
MTAGTVISRRPESPGDTRAHRLAGWLLTRAVRGRRERGTEWGEAMLAEFAHIGPSRESARWAMSAALVAWRERRSGRVAQRQASGKVGLVRRLVGRAALLLVLAIAVEYLLVTVHFIPSGNMEPTYAVGSRVVADLAFFRIGGAERGDTVIANVEQRTPITGRETESYKAVMRVIALGGDRVECRDGKLIRNGSALSEPYLKPGTFTSCGAITVPDGSVYLLADNREEGFDSRHHGPLPSGQLIGRVIASVG